MFDVLAQLAICLLDAILGPAMASGILQLHGMPAAACSHHKKLPYSANMLCPYAAFLGIECTSLSYCLCLCKDMQSPYSQRIAAWWPHFQDLTILFGYICIVVKVHRGDLSLCCQKLMHGNGKTPMARPELCYLRLT